MPRQFAIAVVCLALTSCVGSQSIDNAVNDYYFPQASGDTSEDNESTAVIKLGRLGSKVIWGRPAEVRSWTVRNPALSKNFDELRENEAGR